MRGRVCIAWRQDVQEDIRELEATVHVPLPWPPSRALWDFHTYAIPFGTVEQKEGILEVIRKHNALSAGYGYTNEFVRKSAYEDYRTLQAGAELVGVRAVSLDRPCGSGFRTTILCCNTGESARTFLDWELGRFLNEPAIEVLHGYDCIAKKHPRVGG